MRRAPRTVPVPAGGFRAIAVLRLSSLGDVVLTLPVVHALARAYPAARLTYWVKEEYREVVAHDPAIHHVRVLEREARRLEDLLAMSAELEDADLIVDLHGQARTRILCFRQRAPVLRAPAARLARAALVHARALRRPPPPAALERYARTLAPLGLAPDGPPRVAVGADAEAWGAAWRAGLGPGPVVALLPGARHATKRWPESHWVDLGAGLVTAGWRPCVVSTAGERAELARLAAAVESWPGATWLVEGLPRVGAALGAVDVAVSGDSGLMHLAAARGTPVVALFGSTTPELGFAPAGPGHVVLCRREPCQPCTLHGRERCPLGHLRCLVALEPAVVRDAVERARDGRAL